MSGTKSNQKCVRMSDDTLAIVEKMKGDGFNQKFENIIYEYTRREPELKKRVAALEAEEKRLLKRTNELRTAANGYLSDINRYLEYAAGAANRATKDVSQ